MWHLSNVKKMREREKVFMVMNVSFFFSLPLHLHATLIRFRLLCPLFSQLFLVARVMNSIEIKSYFSSHGSPADLSSRAHTHTHTVEEEEEEHEQEEEQEIETERARGAGRGV